MLGILPLIILVILGCIYAGSLKSPSKRLSVVVCMLLFILFLCYLQIKTGEYFSGYSGYAPIDYKLQNSRDTTDNPKCGKFNYNDINNQISSTGTYDGIRLKSQIVTKPIVDPVTIFSPVGDGIKLTQPLGNEMFPTVDGQPNSPKNMFSFAYNTVSPDCCGSSNISSDMGCVCYSPEQLKMFGHRAGNLTQPIEYPGI
jgi:hypothetical protein